MQSIAIGDEVYSVGRGLLARVVETFPAAVCVRLGILSVQRPLELVLSPQLWRADDIENVSVCRHCGGRDELRVDDEGAPFRVCHRCYHLPRGDEAALQAWQSPDTPQAS